VIEFEHITFTGGEPFLADGLKEHILKCRLKGKGVNLISNGTSGMHDDYDILKDFCLSMIEFPLHSDIPEIHDKLTGHEGSFQKVIRSIQYCLKKNITLCVVCVLTKININRLRQTLLFAEQLGITRFMIARFNIGGRGIARCGELLPPLLELRAAFKEANEFTRQHNLKISANVCLPFCIINPHDFPDIAVSSCSSNLDKMPITIDFMGNVRMCNHSPTIIGNIHDTEPGSIFSSEYIHEWFSACPEYCSGCNNWLSCKGGCKAASEQTGRSLYNEDPVIRFLNNYQTLTLMGTSSEVCNEK